MRSLDRLVKKDSSVVSRRIADEVILIPIKRKAGEIDCLYTLNEVGARIWELIDGQRSVEALRDTLVAEFEINESEAQQDLTELIHQLKEIGVIQEVL
jgi:hypothetical protein